MLYILKPFYLIVLHVYCFRWTSRFGYSNGIVCSAFLSIPYVFQGHKLVIWWHSNTIVPTLDWNQVYVIDFTKTSMCLSMLWCYMVVSDNYKGAGLVPLKRLNPLQLFALVLSQGSDLQYLLLVNVVQKFFSFLVFLYRLDRWFSRLNGFSLVLFSGPL